MWKCNVLNTYEVCSAQSNKTVILISALDKFQKYKASKIKQQGEDVCVSSIHVSSCGKYLILETTAKKLLTELWTYVIVAYAVRHSFFTNPYGDQFKPWSVKCDYPCPVFELRGCKGRLSAPACMREGKTGTKSKSCFCTSLRQGKNRVVCHLVAEI